MVIKKAVTKKKTAKKKMAVQKKVVKNKVSPRKFSGVEWTYDLLTTYKEISDYIKISGFDVDALKGMRVSEFVIGDYSGIAADDRDIELSYKPADEDIDWDDGDLFLEIPEWETPNGYSLYDFYQYAKENPEKELNFDTFDYNGAEITVLVNMEYRWEERDDWLTAMDENEDEAKKLCRGKYNPDL